MIPATQPDLFSTPDSDSGRVGATTTLRVVPIGAQPLSRVQREFNALNESLTRLRVTLGQAEQLFEDYRSHLAKVYEPRWRDLTAVRREWAIAADGVLQGQASLPKGQRLSRRRVQRLKMLLVALVSDLLDELDDDELTDIHDRYSDVSLDESRALDARVAEAMMAQLVGAQAMQNHGADDVEGVLLHAREQLEAQWQAEAERRRTNATGREAQAHAKRERAAKEVTQSVREVYRKLASNLHPDREPDATERARKTQWMQLANVAYEKGDLQQLLALQMTVLQSDQTALTQVGDARLKLYCQTLREQQAVLKTEIAACEAPVRQALGLGPRGPLPTRTAVLAWVDHDAKQIKQGVAEMRVDLARLQDARRCGELIDSLALPDDDGLAMGTLDDLLSSGLGAYAEAPTGGRKRRRG